jgi:gliding motility-associated-like protein
MKPLLFILSVAGFLGVMAQNRLVLNQNVYAKLNGNCNLVIDNGNSNAITVMTGGNIISEAEGNVVKWNIAGNTGNYTVPFTTASQVKIPLSVNLTIAGTGANSAIVFATYETINDDNTNYPSDVTNMNSNCGTNNGLSATDRFWRIDANSYTTKPTPQITFTYDDAANELGGSNTITETKLKAERFNAGANSWETPLKMYGIDNPVANTVSSVVVSPNDFHKSWTLIDTSAMSIKGEVLSQTDVSCFNGNNGMLSYSVAVGGSYMYTLVSAATTVTNTIGTFTNLPADTYSLYVVDPVTGCADQNVMTLLEPLSAVTINNLLSNPSCPNEPTGSASVDVFGGTPTYSVSWSNGKNGTSVSYIGVGVYTITVTDSEGCVGTYSLEVEEKSCAVLFVPEIFSPNGDGKNDNFNVTKIDEYPNNSLSIFNRWGSLVYFKKKYTNEWDGKANVGDAMGKSLLPSGTYYVVLDFGDGETEPYHGFVQLEY